MNKKTAEKLLGQVQEVVGSTPFKIEETWRFDEGGVPYVSYWIYAYPFSGCIMGFGLTTAGALKDFKEAWGKRDKGEINGLS